jgi:hypothetical protein
VRRTSFTGITHLSHRRDPTHSTSTEVSEGEEERQGEGPSDAEEMLEWGGDSEGAVTSDEYGVGAEEEEQEFEPSADDDDAPLRSVALILSHHVQTLPDSVSSSPFSFCICNSLSESRTNITSLDLLPVRITFQ